MKIKKILEKLSEEHCKSVAHISEEIQKAIDLAWENDDPKTKEYQRKVFPNGKPTLEDFLEKSAEKAKKELGI